MEDPQPTPIPGGLKRKKKKKKTGRARKNLCPEALIDRNLLEAEIPLGMWIRGTARRRRRSLRRCEGDVEAFLSFSSTRKSFILHYVIGVAGEGGAEPPPRRRCVLVDMRLDVLGTDRVLPRLQGHDPGLHVEVAAELLPDDVDVTAEDEVRLVR